MFKIIKYMYFSWYCFRCYNFMRLRHISSPINFTLMIDLQFNLNSLIFWNSNSTLSWCTLACVASGGIYLLTLHLIETFFVLSSIFRWFLGHFHFNNLNIVLLIIRCMRSNQEPLYRPVAVEGPKNNESGLAVVNLRIAVGHPLNSEWWPGQCVGV